MTISQAGAATVLPSVLMNIINSNEPQLSAAAAIVCEPRGASEKFILALNLFQTVSNKWKKKIVVGFFFVRSLLSQMFLVSQMLECN